MKSIKTKISVLVIACTVLTSSVVGILSIWNAKEIIREDSTQLMHQVCKNSAQEINAAISRIEQSVDTLCKYALGQLNDINKFQNDASYVAEFSAKMESIVKSAAESTEGAMSAYLRYNPEFTEPTSGLFFSRNSSDVDFETLVPTDFSIYDKSDAAHVGWYYIPIENKKATWMSPYLNENIQVEMISYVVPIFKDGITVGIIGMDINFDLLKKIIESTSIYKTGYAFLLDRDNSVLFHKDLKMNEKLSEVNQGELAGLSNKMNVPEPGDFLLSYKYEGEQKSLTFVETNNGMKIALSALNCEINEAANNLTFQIIICLLAAIAISTVVAIAIIIRGITRPIQQLNKVAKRIAKGDLEVAVEYSSTDEIGELADSLKQTVNRLKDYIKYIDEISAILEEIAQGNLKFELKYEYLGEFTKIKVSMQHISRSLNSTLFQINKAAEQVAGTTIIVSSGAQVLSDGSMQQASSVEELSVSISDISEHINQSAKSAKDAYALASEAGSKVAESDRHMHDMLNAMEDISNTSNKISEIIMTIGDIAKKTNILALNASVEAARAGEAGRGFTIVAQEVSSLADKVGQAAKTTAALIERSIQAVNHGTKIAGVTEESLQAVVEKAEEIVKKVEAISIASESQAKSITQVTAGIGQISDVVQSNNITAQEGADASDALSHQAVLLKELLTNFKLNDEK